MATKYPQYNYGTGRRKSAIARVFLKAGKGDTSLEDTFLTLVAEEETEAA